MARVELDGVTRDAEGTRILDRVTFQVEDGEFVAIIGSSGAGKTSVLRAIAGFDPLVSGRVRFDGQDMTDVATVERDVGMISQHNTLFPTYRVRSNLMFPLWRRTARAEARKRVEAESRAHNIDHILDRWPESLSGGEQQLAQIARALVRVPRVFLMDEPMAQLDVRVRQRLRQEIVELQRGYGVTMVYASNRPDEIMSMPDRLVALDGGRVVQIGKPREIRARPTRLSLAELTGSVSRLAVRVEADDDGYVITAPGVRLRAWLPALDEQVGRKLTLAIRGDDARLAPNGPLTMTVHGPTFIESRAAIELRSDAGSVYTHDTDATLGSQVSATLDRWLLYDDAGHLVMSFPS